MGLNCDHIVRPSPLLIITVLMPYLRAVAMIEETLPLLERETYQIHMPRPASAPESPDMWIVRAFGFLEAAATESAANASPVTNSPTSRATKRPRCSVMRPATNATVA